MKTLEALKCIDDGKKMRKIEWKEGKYIHKNDNGDIRWYNGMFYYSEFNFNDEWEEYQEIPKDVEYFVSMLIDRDGEFFGCKGIYCTKCPLNTKGMSCILDAANELIAELKDKEGKHNEV